jgi:Tol biopolymer transport system component
MNADGSNRKQITTTEGKGVNYPIFSPDGKRLAYSIIESKSYIINLETDFAAQTPFEFPPLNEKGDNFIAWSWSPDGKKIAGWSGNELDIESSELFIYSVETNSYEKISDNFNRPSWLADNIHIIGTVDEKLAVINTQTGQIREILSLAPQFINSPAISPDNRRVAFSAGTIEADIQMLSLK